MADIQSDILAALRMQEAALLGVLETVRQAIQTILSTQTTEALDGMNNPKGYTPSGTTASLTVDNLPAVYHNNCSSFSFADGHAEIHKWISKQFGTWSVARPATQLMPDKMALVMFSGWFPTPPLRPNVCE